MRAVASEGELSDGFESLHAGGFGFECLRREEVNRRERIGFGRVQGKRVG